MKVTFDGVEFQRGPDDEPSPLPDGPPAMRRSSSPQRTSDRPPTRPRLHRLGRQHLGRNLPHLSGAEHRGFGHESARSGSRTALLRVRATGNSMRPPHQSHAVFTKRELSLFCALTPTDSQSSVINRPFLGIAMLRPAVHTNWKGCNDERFCSSRGG